MVIGYVIKVIVTKYGEQIVFFSGKSLKNLLQALNSFKEIKIFGKEKLFLKAYIYNENQLNYKLVLNILKSATDKTNLIVMLNKLKKR